MSWSLNCEAGEPRIAIERGRLDAARVGYLYRVPAATFERIDDLQWVSHTPVRPLAYDVIRPAEYARWIMWGNG